MPFPTTQTTKPNSMELTIPSVYGDEVMSLSYVVKFQPWFTKLLGDLNQVNNLPSLLKKAYSPPEESSDMMGPASLLQILGYCPCGLNEKPAVELVQDQEYEKPENLDIQMELEQPQETPKAAPVCTKEAAEEKPAEKVKVEEVPAEKLKQEPEPVEEEKANDQDVKDTDTICCNSEHDHEHPHEEVQEEAKLEKKETSIDNVRGDDEYLLDLHPHEARYFTNPKTGRQVKKLVCLIPGCGKIFEKKWNFKDHIRMHMGEKPYKCSQCPKSFTQKGNLAKHMRQHEYDNLKSRKVHHCTICNKKFTEKYNLKVSVQKWFNYPMINSTIICQILPLLLKIRRY